MTEIAAQLAQKQQQHNKLLILIAAYKGLQAVLFVAVGIGALRLLHKDVDDVLSQIAIALASVPNRAWSTSFSTKPRSSTTPSCAASALPPSSTPA